MEVKPLRYEEDKEYVIKGFKFMFVQLLDTTHSGQIQIWRVKFDTSHLALKIIPKAYINTSAAKNAYLKSEIQAMIDFDHLGIIKLIKDFEDKLNFYLLMEVAYGAPLHKVLQAERCIHPSVIPYIAVQLCYILDYIHSKGYIYRDLKASNAILNIDGRVKLIDFGYAKKIKNKRTNSICGTLHTMAPEMFNTTTNNNNNEGYSYEIDYYSLGILLYELALGHPPFGYETEDKLEMIKKIKNEIEKMDFAEIKDEKLKDLIRSLLETNPTKRLGSKNGFKEILSHPLFDKLDKPNLEKWLMTNNQELYEKLDLTTVFSSLEEILWIIGIKEIRERDNINQW